MFCLILLSVTRCAYAWPKQKKFDSKEIRVAVYALVDRTELVYLLVQVSHDHQLLFLLYMIPIQSYM